MLSEVAAARKMMPELVIIDLEMSGHVPEMMATAERQSNVVATIIKPFNASALISLVRRMLTCGPLAPD